ncbi:hypothetical protein [Mesorhizobium sp. 1B3]|uniref:hypothetical protein n=1 Tax=Mesorhizobium sp. 1B3 TaxID=3243599 RepID=UPI003D98F5AD
MVIEEKFCTYQGERLHCTEYMNQCPRRLRFVIPYGDGGKDVSLGPREEWRRSWQLYPSLTFYCGSSRCGDLVDIEELKNLANEETWLIADGMTNLTFRKEGELVQLSDVRPGDVFTVGAHNLFYISPNIRESEWIAGKERTVVVEEIRQDNNLLFPSSRWVRVAVIPTGTAAGMPAPDGNDEAGGEASSQVRNGIWWEEPIAEATGGYDPETNRTLINSYNLVVFGPSSVESAIKAVVEECVSLSAGAAYTAFKATPSPEIAARIGTAWTTFHGALAECFALKSVYSALRKQFDVGYIRRGRWVDGLRLRFTAENPTTEHYKRFHRLVDDKLPDPVNKLVNFYIASQEYPSVDIRLDPPKIARDFLKQLPPMDELRDFLGQAEHLAEGGGKKILSDLKQEATEKFRQLGSEAATAGEKLLHQPVRLVGAGADELKKAAPGIGGALIPRIEDGRVRLGPAVFDVPDVDLPPIDLNPCGERCFGACVRIC